jgi:sulfur carrier protein
MEVRFNNKSISLPDGGSLLDFLRAQNLHETKGIAVAVNETVIPRREWETIILENNSSILVIKAAQGG